MIQNKRQIMTNFTSSARICIDDYNEGEMQGRLYHAYRDEPLTFHNVVTLHNGPENRSHTLECMAG